MSDSAEITFHKPDTDSFWQLIEQTRHASDGDCDKHSELIIAELVKYPSEAIIEFSWIIRQYMAQAYRQDLWDAAYIINCGCGDDAFHDFRVWLIAQGQTIYEAALQNPETLIDIVEVGQETFASIDLIARYAYHRQEGVEIPIRLSHRAVLLGEVDYDKTLSNDEWEAQLALCYPKLYAKFGDCDAWLATWFKPK